MRRTDVSALADMETVVEHPRALQLSDFIDTEYRRVVGSVALITGDHAAAEDAVNDAMVAAWTRRELPIDRIAAWITVAASNNAKSARRRRGAEQRALARLGSRTGDQLTESNDPQPIDDQLHRAMAGLPRREREVAVLHYVLDLSVADTASELGISSGTVKTLLSRARAHLAAALAVDDRDESGDTPDEGEELRS